MMRRVARVCAGTATGLGIFLVPQRRCRPTGNETVPHPSDVLVFVRWVGVRRTPLRRLVLLNLHFCFLLAGCHAAPSLTPQQQEGKHLYQVRCAHCHEDNDLALKKVPPDLHHLFECSTLPSGLPATDAEIRHNVLAGKGLMPSFAGRFSDEQMTALLAYLHTGLR